MTLFEDLRKYNNFKRFDGEIGLEIETETKKSYDPPQFTFWRSDRDGSLRNFGIEYILRQPLKYEVEVEEALKEFKDKTKHLKFIEDSISTSVHVHLNVLNENYLTLGNFLTAYALTENILVRYSGPDRISNLFCLPICDAEETYKNIVEMFKSVQSKKGLRLYDERSVKYAALNLSSMGKYGSVEIRTFRGETKTEVISEWVSILYSLMQFSRNKDMNPKKFMELYKEKGVDILDDIFGEHRKAFDNIENVDKLLDRNSFYAASIAFSVKDWSSLDKRPKKKKPSKEVLDAHSIRIFMKSFDECTEQQQEYITVYVENLNTQSVYNPVWLNQAVREPRRNVADHLIRADELEDDLDELEDDEPEEDF